MNTQIASRDFQVALVTGGGTGIGAAISETLLTSDWHVAIVQDRESDLEAARARFQGFDARVVYILADLAVAQECTDAIRRCAKLLGRLDALINNAGITGPTAGGPIFEYTDDAFSRLIEVNLKAPYRLAREAGFIMRDARRGGVIINIGSVASFVTLYEGTAYSAAKSGLLGLTKGLALELAPYQIRVILVAPGDIDTPTSSGGAFVKERRSHPWYRPVPLGRRGRPEDVAATVKFLLSPQAAYITGSAVVVDGGFLSY